MRYDTGLNPSTEATGGQVGHLRASQMALVEGTELRL